MSTLGAFLYYCHVKMKKKRNINCEALLFFFAFESNCDKRKSITQLTVTEVVKFIF